MTVNHRGNWSIWLYMVVWALLIAGPVFAQLPTGTILGVVKDSSGAVIPGVTITIRNTDTDHTRTAVTGADGTYRVPALAVGHYEVKAEHGGFQTEAQQGLMLNVSEDVVVNPVLKVGTTQQEVFVTEVAPLVNTTSSSLGGLVDENKLSNLPLNGRNYADLALLQAGVAEDRNEDSEGTTAGTWYSSNGAPPRSNNYILDGAPLVNLYGGSSAGATGSTLGVDGIQEYKLITNSFTAEYGQTMGSQMVMVSKGGSNQFHGDVFEYFRNSALDARNYFDTPKIPEFRRNQFGGSFGGPIKRDKSFFYAVYEGLRLLYGTTSIVQTFNQACFNEVATQQKAGTNPITVNAACLDDGSTVNTATVQPVMIPLLNLFPAPNQSPAAGLDVYRFSFPSPTSVNYGQIRLDHNFSDKDSMFGRYTIDNAYQLTTAGGTQASIGASFPDFLSAVPGRDQFLTLAENHVFSSALLNSVRLSYSRTNQANVDGYGAQGLISGPMYSFTKTNGKYNPIGNININTFTQTYGSDSQLPNTDIQDIYTLSDDVYYTKGKHALKFGFLLNRYQLGLNVGADAIGTINFNDVASFLLGAPQSYQSLSSTSNTNRDFIYWSVGMYAQDDFRATQRLTLNLGLRYEFYTSPRETNGRGGNFRDAYTPQWANDTVPTTTNIIDNSSLKDFEPRVGFAWDVFGDGKTSLRGGFGIFYDIGNIGSIFQQSAQATPPISVRSSLSFPDDATAEATYLPTAPLLFYPTTGLNTAGLRLVSYQTRPAHMLQYNLTGDRQLPKSIALSLSYVGSRGIDLWHTTEANPILPTAFIGNQPVWQPYLCGGVASVLNTGGCGQNPAYHRVNQNFASGTISAPGSESWYNSLQAVVTKNVSNGLEFQAAYTWARSIDTTSGQMSGGDCRSDGIDQYPYGGVPQPLIFAKGPSCSDVQNNFHVNVLYHLPDPHMNGISEKALSGWLMGNIVSLESGLPFNLVTGLRSNSGFMNSGPDYPNVNTAASIAAAGPCTSQPGQPAAGSNPCAYTPIPYNKNTVITGNPNQWVNPAMFSLPPTGMLGNEQRGLLRGPHLYNWDFSLVKDTAVKALGEAGNVEFRAEFFNIMNHPNFGQIPVQHTFPGKPQDIGSFSEAPSAGGSAVISSSANSSRQIQLALKLIF
jgi:hypothetical protein